jgi:FKBP-type peptidyl-prolyl cis-trans isomerase FkpA
MRIPALLLAAVMLPLAACAKEEQSAPPTTASTVESLQIIELVEGEGVEAESGRVAVVHYTGWLFEPSATESKGAKFDSSVDRGRPFKFPVGGGRVIKGWDVGVAGMKAGGKRRLIIPSDMAYGQRGAGGSIPPGATLVFDVELLDVE